MIGKEIARLEARTDSPYGPGMDNALSSSRTEKGTPLCSGSVLMAMDPRSV